MRKIFLIIVVIFCFSCQNNKNKTEVSTTEKEFSTNEKEFFVEGSISVNMNGDFLIENYENSIFKIEIDSISSNDFRVKPLSFISLDTILYRNFVAIDTTQIVLKFDNKTEQNLKNNSGIPYDENRVNYFYRGFLPELNSFVIESRAYEDNSVFLFNKENGKRKEIENIPYISKNKSFIFTYIYNPYEDYSKDDEYKIEPPTNDIYIYSIKNQEINLVTRIKVNREIESHYWKNDSILSLKTSKIDNETEKNFFDLKIIRIDKNLLKEERNLNIKDSLFIGCPQVIDKQFLYEVGGKYDLVGDSLYYGYRKIFKDKNKLYSWKPNTYRELKIDDITLKLLRKPYKKKGDVEITLELYKNNVKTDELLFYRDIYDFMEQRLTCMSYIEGDYIWTLEGYTESDELVVVYEYHRKYKIDKSGKFLLLQEVNVFEMKEYLSKFETLTK